ncbi:hypothetical protein HID58_062175 [Brassica napus]|uniref:Uncharacterized protein n=1 Tax=Brassica napus TaxID=3708 RepID=A0ABQ8A0M9_BRANA|nr:hypothetical protein HID58_062175 [Brassica napus]
MNFNFIRYFLRPSGDLITDPFLMSFHAVTHFQKILGPMPAPAVGIISTSLWFRSLTGFFCSDSQCLQMTTFPAAEEITVVFIGHGWSAMLDFIAKSTVPRRRLRGFWIGRSRIVSSHSGKQILLPPQD